MPVRIDDSVAAVGRRISANFGPTIRADRKRCARLDGGLIELDIRDGVAGAVWQRCTEAAIAQDAKCATALDAPSPGDGVCCVDIRGVVQDEYASTELHH